MYANVRSLGVTGVGGYELSLEVWLSGGLPAFEIVGLPDAAVRESGDRVRAAIRNNGFPFPPSRVTVNLAPADKKKEGPVYDLPMMIGILAAGGNIPLPAPDSAFLGELSLTGQLRPISGALPMAFAALRCGVKELFLPEENAAEAAFAEGLTVYPVKDVMQLFAHLKGEKLISPAPVPALTIGETAQPDFAEAKGQEDRCWPGGCLPFCRI